MSVVSPRTIRNLAIVVALFVAPVLTYGSAYMLYKQVDVVNLSQAKKSTLTKAPIKTNDGLPQELKDQISAAIAMVE